MASCPPSALLDPLSLENDGAFNPCFLLCSLALFICAAAPAALIHLIILLRRPHYGPVSPKSTGMLHFIQCSLVLAIGLNLVKLTSSVFSFQSLQSFVFLALAVLVLFIILPTHVIERNCLPIQSKVLLAFWPLWLIAQATFIYQDLLTKQELFDAQDVQKEIANFVLSILVFGLEANKSTWRPSHQLKAHYMKTESLEKQLKQPNLLQRITFSYMNPLIKSSYDNGTLLHTEIPETPPRISSKAYTDRLLRFWEQSTSKSKSGLVTSLVKAFGLLGLVSFTYELVDKLLNFVQPQLLRRLILFIEEKSSNPSTPLLKGFLISFAMFLVTIIQTTITNEFMLSIVEFGFACRSSLGSLVFQKSLKLSTQARTDRASGDVVNLVSIDTPRVQACAQEISTLILAPTEFIVCMWSLWSLLGKSSLAAILVILVSIPLNSLLIRKRKKLSKKQMKIKDERNRVTNEIMVCMRSIKFYAWEQPMLKTLLDLRNGVEMKNLLRLRLWSQVADFVWIMTPYMVYLATFASFALTSDVPLSSDIAFPALTLLRLLSRPILQFPTVFNFIIEGSIALDRIAAFLNSPEVDPGLIDERPHSENESLVVENLSFLWNRPQHSPISDIDHSEFTIALNDITIKANKGDLVCAVGKVGSGKSALLYSIIGLLEAMNSSSPKERPTPICVHGSVAYCAQSPWIMNASVRDNILFGHEYDETYYNKTIEACQLLPDLKILPDNDMTQVGEKGISLSGGQRARISLARAVYARADVYLLDDVLSAVDGHVGKAIMTNVFSSSGLLSDKTVIMATNNIKVLPYATRIYLLEEGRIVEESEFTSLGENNTPKLMSLVSEFGGTQRSAIDRNSTDDLDGLVQISEPVARATLAPFEYDPMKSNAKSKRTAQSTEVSAKGKVKWSIYWNYIKACSVSGALTWFGCSVLKSLISVRTNYWLKQWAERNSEFGDNAGAMRYIVVYGLLGFLSCASYTLASVLLWCVFGLRAGMKIHDNMAKQIVKAPMLFFERTPVGRILNRFSNDVNKVDGALPRSFNQFTGAVMGTTVTLAIVIYTIPASFGILLIMAFVYLYYQKYYVAVQREMKRLVSVSRSPIFGHLQESLNGAETIRAYKHQDRFIHINDANVDFNLKSLYILRSVNRWLSVRLQLMGSIIIWTSSSLLIYKASTTSKVTAGLVGFVMSYSLLVTSNLRLIVRYSAEVESNIVSVERCTEYAELESEEHNDADFVEPPEQWPSQGKIEFKDYSTKYAENLDLVLKNISFTVNPSEKVGVVGRTGAGKSSLVAAIFRIIPAYSGSISIDGISNAYLRLFDLRHNLSIIPQDSHMFEGTIRQNLDPIGEHDDERLWHCLELAGLKETIENLKDGAGLDSKVSEGGQNFSGGQRQLICLGRALLNPSRVLVLDEATAAVDVQTDKIIQETIRKEFKHKTIITIAHRLDTVMDSDRILTLDHGEVKEYDTPHNLLSDKSSIFAGMCEAHN